MYFQFIIIKILIYFLYKAIIVTQLKILCFVLFEFYIHKSSVKYNTNCVIFNTSSVLYFTQKLCSMSIMNKVLCNSYFLTISFSIKMLLCY